MKIILKNYLESKNENLKNNESISFNYKNVLKIHIYLMTFLRMKKIKCIFVS